MLKNDNLFNYNFKEEEINLLNNFKKDFLEYNAHTNLISKNDEAVLYEKHILDSLSFNLFLRKYSTNFRDKKLLDIGTGGGFPSLPLALIFKDLKIVAVDSIAKKIAFLEQIKQQYNLENLTPLTIRMEQLDKNYLASFDFVTSRAVAKLNIILEYAMPFLRIGGFFVAYKSILASEEIKDAQNALDVLGGEIIDTINYNLQTDNNYSRCLIIIKKISKTPNKYPRAVGLAKKQPL